MNINRRLTKTERKDNWTESRFRDKLRKLRKRLGCNFITVKPRGGFRKTFSLVYLFDPRLPYVVNKGETAFYVKGINA